MKKKRRLFICSIITLLGLIILPFIFKVSLYDTDNSLLWPTPMATVPIPHHFIAVSSFKNFKTDYTLAEILESDLVALPRSQEYLNSLLPETEIEYVSQDELDTKIAAGAIAILDEQGVSPRYKSLMVGGVNYWDKSFITDNSYPFTWVEYIDQSKVTANMTKEHERMQLYFTGEIIPARAVDRLALNKNNNYTYLFDFFKNEISNADIAIGLLENPLSGNPSPCTGCMSFVGDEQNAQGLKDVGFDILSLAGNHAGDGGQGAYSATLKNLDAVGIKHTGVGNSDTAKLTPAIIEVNGKKIGMISADTVASYYWQKGSSYYGTNWFSQSSNSQVDLTRVQLIPQLKEDNNIDYLIIYMSWGVEYTNKATNFQKELAHALIDNGADLVIGSHPHWVQNIEFYNDKPIIYSLGNFIFDQNHSDPTRQGMNAMLYFYDGQLKSIELEPHLSCGPFISSNNITNDYLSGKINMQDLLQRDERTGCVYFQPLKLPYDSPVYKQIWERSMQYSDFNY